MTITGLENNYYLSQNDIWIKVGGIVEKIASLELSVKNLTTSKELSAPLRLYPSPTNDFHFNICLPVRALFPYPSHIVVNSLQFFEITFTIKFDESEIPDEVLTLSKFFVRGGRNKNGNDEWYLSASQELIVGRWIDWGIALPTFAKRIQGATIVDFIPSNPFKINLRNNCNYTAVKFLNSLGGYQYYIFESHEIKTKSKAGKTVSRIANQLREDNFLNVGIDIENSIEFQAKTPFEVQDLITDLISSFEILLYNPDGTDENSRWQRLSLESNDSIKNTFDRVYENKLKFSFSNSITRTL